MAFQDGSVLRPTRHCQSGESHNEIQMLSTSGPISYYSRVENLTSYCIGMVSLFLARIDNHLAEKHYNIDDSFMYRGLSLSKLCETKLASPRVLAYVNNT